MRGRLVTSCALVFLASTATTESLEAQRSNEVIWRDEGHTRVSFVPGTLLRSLGSWDGDEMPPLSGIGLLDEEVETLKESVRWAKARGRISTADLLAGKCPNSMVDAKSQTAPDGTSSSKPLAEWLRALGGRAYIARISAMEPGWSPSSRSAVTLVRFGIVTPLAGVESGAALEEVTMLGGFGWLHLGSATLCRVSDSVLSAASLGDELFIWERGGERDRPLSRVLMILPASSDGIDTTSCKYCAGESLVSLASLRGSLERP